MSTGFVPRPQAPSPPIVAPPTGPRVLLVDDDEDDMLFMQQAFTHAGKPCQLFFATDGIDCLRFLEEKTWLPDLVLLDLNMPLLNGFEVLQHLQISSRWRGLPVIMLSTAHGDQVEKTALVLGAKAYLTKPSHYADYRLLVDQLYTLYL